MIVNTLKTTLLLSALGGVLIVIGGLVDGGQGAVIGLALGLMFCGGSYWFSDTLAIKAAQARSVTEQQMPDYYRIVRELAQRDGVPMPELYVAPSMQPNAFATGRSPRHAKVAVTEGILGVLNWQELQGVLAHELSHVKNRDILIGSVAAALAMGITYIAQIAQFGLIFGRNRDDEESQNPIVAILLIVLAPTAAALLQLAVTRSREYQADESGARLLGTGEPLATALEKIERGVQTVPMNINPAQATAYIVNPLTGRQMTFSNLFLTHPPTADRIARLRREHFASR